MSRYGLRGSDINKYPSVVSNIMRLRDEKRRYCDRIKNKRWIFIFIFFVNYHISVEAAMMP